MVLWKRAARTKVSSMYRLKISNKLGVVALSGKLFLKAGLAIDARLTLGNASGRAATCHSVMVPPRKAFAEVTKRSTQRRGCK